MDLCLGPWVVMPWTDVILLSDSSQGTAQRAYLSGPLDFQREGTPGADGQYWPSCEPRSPFSEQHSSLSVSSYSSSHLLWCSRLVLHSFAIDFSQYVVGQQ